MGIAEIILTGIGLSADAFSASVCKGLNMPRGNLKQGYIVALFFGIFQAAMPVGGYLLGTGFAGYISGFDHWAAFILLAFIGGKMVWGAFSGGDETEKSSPLRLGELTVLAVATSIDALAVGITFAFLNVNVLAASAIIGTITFALSLAGTLIGSRFGAKYKNKAELAGGVILILIGLKILLEHLNVISAP